MSDKAEQKSVQSTPNASETEVHVQPQTSKHNLVTPLKSDFNTSPLQSLAKTVGEVGGTIPDTALGVGVIVGGSALEAQLLTPNSQLLQSIDTKRKF
ncbi:MAG: hypothetical protein ACFB2X_24810 [Rivularia sp. (in: cyanobacteria)]